MNVQDIEEIDLLINKRFKAVFYSLMEQECLSQAKLGQELGLENPSTVSRVLNGVYKGKYLIGQINLSSLILESEAITPLELIVQDTKIKLDYFSGDLDFGYRVIRNKKLNIYAIYLLCAYQHCLVCTKI